MKFFRWMGVLCLWCTSITELLSQDVSLTTKLGVQQWNASDGEQVASYFRRGRIVTKAKIGDALSMHAAVQFDYLGKDNWAPPAGKTSDGTLKLWDCSIAWRPLLNVNALEIRSGYLLPQLSRETVTTPWFVSSLDKACSSNYLRKFATGKTNGISPGLSVGGVIGLKTAWIQYNVSVLEAFKGVTQEGDKSVLTCGRIDFGRGKAQNYAYKSSGNTFTSENSLSFGFNGSVQGRTSIFDQNVSYGADFVAKWHKLTFNGELMKLKRKQKEQTYSGYTGFVRTSSLRSLPKNRYLEPSIMVTYFCFDVNYTDFDSGKHVDFDIGINYYFYSKALKIALHALLNNELESNFEGIESFKNNTLVLGIQVTI